MYSMKRILKYHLRRLVEQDILPTRPEFRELLQRPNPEMNLEKFTEILWFQYEQLGKAIVWMWFDKHGIYLQELHPVPVDRCVTMTFKNKKLFPDYPEGFLVVKDNSSSMYAEHIVVDMACVIVLNRKSNVEDATKASLL